jgi:glycosyltransferase involved in cell wall biosynthesis
MNVIATLKRTVILRVPHVERLIARALDVAASVTDRRFMGQPPIVDERRGGAHPPELDIGTVAFNNADVIRDQIVALRELLQDDYRYWVFDNSTDAAARAEIRRACEEHGVSYLQLPDNPMSRMNPSRSHGVAMNWAYRNVLADTGSRYFGFIDPDIYPTERCSVLAAMGEQPCYGRLEERGKAWYLWAGFCFFRNPMTRSLDFLPVRDLDTGGAGWKRYYRFVDRSAMEFPSITPETPETPERVGTWVHLSNSSRWRDDHVGPRPAAAPS